MNEILKTLKERRSIRSYRPEPLDEAQLDAILEAGTWAASAMCKQSPVLVVVQDAQTRAQLTRLNARIQGNPDADPFYGAPTIVAVLADPALVGEENAQRDGSLVIGNLMTAAWSLGVGSCWINRAQETFALPEGKELLRKWGLPEHLVGVGNCALGYIAGDVPAPRPRKDGRILRV